ncbi:nuclear transport factor 2 family protein [Novosphingobium sp. BW1]|uniref:nuclear transport factor 2 family protein n=1 Tax=Novosphingobium sp. BW1 TaxID=2592621 RepID=UPI0011DE9BE6|nr:nuclear transport factor 2 family protein [Novosphingobium sp. BW1]TYC86538.1 nuclear transport factor 2 family protein [Novosphingobium sp. BW1]
MSQNVEIIEKIYALFECGDIESAMAMMSPEIIWYEAEHFPYADGNPYRGREEVRINALDRLYRDWANFRQQVEAIFDAGNAVVMTGRYNGILEVARFV